MSADQISQLAATHATTGALGKTELSVSAIAFIGVTATTEAYHAATATLFGQVAGDKLVTLGFLGLSWAEWMKVLAAIWLVYQIITLTVKNIQGVKRWWRERKKPAAWQDLE